MQYNNFDDIENGGGRRGSLKNPLLLRYSYHDVSEWVSLSTHFFCRFSRYHDVPDVLDFLVLRQAYDTSINRNWRPGGYTYLMEQSSVRAVFI